MGKSIAIWGPAGSPGRSTIAISLAAELALRQKRVLLIDLDTFGGVINIYLGLEDQRSGLAAACYRGDSASFTADDLIELTYEVPVGKRSFQLLSGIPQASRWGEVSQMPLLNSLALGKRVFDYIVMDLSSALDSVGTDGRGRLNYAVMSASDLLLLVGAGDPLGLCRFMRSWPEIPKANQGSTLPILPVINKVRASAIGAKPIPQLSKMITDYTALGQIYPVNFDQPLFDQLVLSGRLLADYAPKSTAARQIAALADACQ